MTERSRTTGWLPSQHGVWAMLALPFAAGTAMLWHEGHLPVYLAPLFATWILGYFAFFAASGLLKSPRPRRGRWTPAVAVYCGSTLGAGLLTVWSTGPGPWWWLAGFALPLGFALWLAVRRDERNLAGGLLTVACAAVMVYVIRFPDPVGMFADPAFPATTVLALAISGYLGGTVFHVKAMIRKRGRLAWRNASIGWQALWAVIAAGGVLTGHAGRWWPPFFLLATIRAWLLPVLGEPRRMPAPVIGIVEIGLSLTFLALTIADVLTP